MLYMLAFLALLSGSTPMVMQGAPGSDKTRFIDRAIVHHANGRTTVYANDSRPLEQALSAVADEHGWILDFEDPPFEAAPDLVDDTDLNWRAQHPNAKGVTRVAGGQFEVEYSDLGSAEDSNGGELRILHEIIAAYHRSGNPGRFVLRDEGDGRYSIVGTKIRTASGTEKSVFPIFDTPITLEKVDRSALDTVTLIVNTLSNETRTKIFFGSLPAGYLINERVSVGGTSVPARRLLSEALSVSKRKLVWHLLYDADIPTYGMNIDLARKSYVNKLGRKVVVPLGMER